LSSVVRQYKNPVLANELNINGTLNVASQPQEKTKLKRLFLLHHRNLRINCLPVKENLLPKFQSPYALTKLTGEYYCQLFSELYGLPTVALRYFNVYGPRQKPEIRIFCRNPIILLRAF